MTFNDAVIVILAGIVLLLFIIAIVLLGGFVLGYIDRMRKNKC